MLKIQLTRDDLLRALFIGWVVLLLSACNPLIPPQTSSETASVTETQAIPTSPAEGGATQMAPTLPTPADPGVQGLIEKAREDLARRLSVTTSDIILVDAQSVTWPDASLGCPQEGMVYAQVLTSGYLIRLKSGDHEFEYHAGKGTTVVYCENPTPPVPSEPGNT